MSDRCKKEIMRGYHLGHCQRAAAIDGWCKQHHPAAEQASYKKRSDKWDEQHRVETERRERNRLCTAALRGLNPAAIAGLLEACDTVVNESSDADEDWIRAAVADLGAALAKLRSEP